MTLIILFKYFAVLTSIIFISILAFKKGLPTSKKSLIPIIIFIAILFHSISFSSNPEESIERSIFSILFIISFLMAVALAPKMTLRYVQYSIFIIGVFYIFSSYFAMIFLPGAYVDDNFYGITSNSNYFALFLSVLFFPVLIKNISNKEIKGISKLFNILLILSLFFILLETRSRGSILTIMSTLFCYIYSKTLINRKKFNAAKILPFIFFGLCIVFISNSNFMTNKYSESNELSFENTFATRAIMYEYRIVGISEKPYLGWGYSINSHENRMIEPWVFNLYEKGTTPLAIIEEFGILFGVPILIFFIWLVHYSFKRIQDEPGIFLIIIGSIIHGLFETWLFNFNSYYCWYFWLCITIGLQLDKKILKIK